MFKLINGYIQAYRTRLSNWLIYKSCKWKGMTDAEIADAYVFPSSRTPRQHDEIAKLLRDYIKKSNTQMTPEEKNHINELAEKYKKEDNG